MAKAIPTLFQTHEQCEAAEPRYVDRAGKTVDPLTITVDALAKDELIAKPRAIPISGGLMLQVMPRKDADGQLRVGRSWLFRYSIDGKERRMDLGPISEMRLDGIRGTLVEANRLQGLVDQKVDPLDQRKREKQGRQDATDRRRKTFAVVAEEYVATHEHEWTKDYAVEWRRLMCMYANPIIGDIPVSDLTKAKVLECIRPNWRTHTAVMQKVRVRIGTAIDYAVEAGYRPEGLANPAAASGFKLLLTAPKKLDTRTRNRPALDHTRLPEFMTLVRGTKGNIARALEFAVLTAARENMVRRAVWEEINWKTGVWEVPRERMKSDRPHRVPLSPAAMAILLVM
jgi:hypothetical protein